MFILLVVVLVGVIRSGSIIVLVGVTKRVAVVVVVVGVTKRTSRLLCLESVKTVQEICCKYW